MLSCICMVLLLLVALLIILHTEISIDPFYIRFHNWRFVIGVILIFLGIEIISDDAVRKYREKIKKEINEYVEKN